MKYVVAKDMKALEVIQDKAIKSVHSARDAIQVALVATIIHIASFGDYRVASRLVEGLGNTVNGAAVVEWFKRFGHLNVNDDGFSGFTVKDYKTAIESTLNTEDGAKATLWWNLKIVNPFKGYSADDALNQFIKNHKSMTAKLMTLPPEDAAKINTVINETTLQQVLALANFDAIITPDVETEASKLAALIALDNA